MLDALSGRADMIALQSPTPVHVRRNTSQIARQLAVASGPESSSGLPYSVVKLKPSPAQRRQRFVSSLKQGHHLRIPHRDHVAIMESHPGAAFPSDDHTAKQPSSFQPSTLKFENASIDDKKGVHVNVNECDNTEYVWGPKQ
ncbi:hypothetical protein PVAR5_0996 [Paecilomyces variotii No. 5]|uniref:Uncharacterized protein n=1 Tax=Byssochlamys spectabilis (strain No. 5 / NBRC 109023) TaxID=1356009 RepID=V5HSK3_BYSSN|nr:hypothetical protein PVAR5_0996 [Paecilomyces variotii No. 5]